MCLCVCVYVCVFEVSALTHPINLVGHLMVTIISSYSGGLAFEPGNDMRCFCPRASIQKLRQLFKVEIRGQLKCDVTPAETRFRLSAKRTSQFKSAGGSVQSTTDSRGVRISGSNAAYTMFRGSVNGTGYPLYSPVSPSLPLLCVTVCHHVSAEVYQFIVPLRSFGDLH